MVYLDNAATGGFKPVSVQHAVSASLMTPANPGRSGHRLSLACAEQVNACRELLSDLFEGYGLERTVFTRSCTEALNLAILGGLSAGEHVVATCLEHNSVLRPLHVLEETGVGVSFVPLEDGEISPEAVAARVTEKTKMAIVTAASNVTGYAPNLAAIRAVLPARVLFVVDGAQGAGHLPIRMQSMGIDALALAGHKGLHAIQGAAALLFSERMNPKPLLFGGTGSESFNPAMPDFYPDRLEAGTLSYPAICSLFEGALLVKSRLPRDAAHLLSLTEYTIEKLGKMKDFVPYSKPNACGIVAFRHTHVQSEAISSLLSERFDIAVRGGLHCAPLAHRALGTFDGGLVRASFSPFQGKREADALLAALKNLTVSL